jgi:hypothetical protein
LKSNTDGKFILLKDVNYGPQGNQGLLISPRQLEEHGIHWDRAANGNFRLFGNNKDVALVAKPNRSSRLLVIQATIQRRSTSTYAAFGDVVTRRRPKQCSDIVEWACLKANPNFAGGSLSHPSHSKGTQHTRYVAV